MTRALCIPFHRYHPHYGEYYKIYYKNLLRTLEMNRGAVDTIYIVDSDWGFGDDELKTLESYVKNVVFIKKEREGHHWVQFKTALPYIHEDQVLFMDNDVVFYREGIIANWFKEAENYDIYTAFDGSGGLKEQVQSKFPFMGGINATRMGSYYFIVNRDALEVMRHVTMAPINPYTPGTYIDELDYKTVEGDWSDSFGLLTIKFLGREMKFGFLKDDRSSVYLDREQGFTYDPAIAWDLGYYHIRNGNEPVYMLNIKECDEAAYAERLKIVPMREALRILAWAVVIDESLMTKAASIASDYEIPYENWCNYLVRFKEYHHV